MRKLRQRRPVQGLVLPLTKSRVLTQECYTMLLLVNFINTGHTPNTQLRVL